MARFSGEIAGLTVEFQVLGPFRVVHADDEVGLGGLQQRAALALMLLHAPEPVTADRLVDELWGERPPASASHAVQVYVSEIRKLLRRGDDAVAVRSVRAGYVLEIDPEMVDIRRFERLIAEAQPHLETDPARAGGLFAQALALWRGTPLAEFEQFEWARREADRLEELRATALEGLAEARLARGEHAEVIGSLTGLVAANPLRERPRRLLMLALYRSGRHAEALATYREGCAALDEIGLQPGPELRQLEEAILRHDPTLGPADSTAKVAAPVRPQIATPARRETPAPRRKTATALVCDVTGTSGAGEDVDPEALQAVMSGWLGELRSVIERHGGTIERSLGETVMAVFGIPRVHEDDALRAVRAAAELRGRLAAAAAEIGPPLRFRSAINTGPVLVSEDEHLAIGDAVNVAVRLAHAAPGGEIVLGEETLRLVRDAVAVEPIEPVVLPGRAAPVRAFRLLDVDPLAPGLARHLDLPLIGRSRELGLLRGAFERAVDASACHLFTLMGAAGIGKSRLVAELLAGSGHAGRVLSGRCLPYGEGITFWPLVEVLAPVGEPARSVLEHLDSGSAATPEELFWEVRRLLESVARERPLIVHVDDLQWGQPMLLDLLDHVVDLSRGAPILMLCSARPELLEERPAWGGGKLNATTLLLEALSADDCELLLDQLGDGLAPVTRRRVISASQGNPLFLEEMAALVRERGASTVPSTIQALLAARLERLPRQERELLEYGAIEGEVFHEAALRALAAEPADRELGSRLARLVRKELIRPERPALQDGEAFRFRHLLIRDAAYDSLPKANRAHLHEQFATWLEHDARDLADFDEIAGWHLEQTVRYQSELGRRRDPEIAGRSAEHLHAAGRRAAARSDPAAARNLLERAHALAPDDDARRRIGVDLAEQLIEGEDLTRVDALLTPAEQAAETASAAALIRLHWSIFSGGADAQQTVELALPGLMEDLAQAGDERGLALAHMAGVQTQWVAAQFTLAAEEARVAAEHARRAGDEGLRARALGWFVGSLVWGRHDPGTMARELDVLASEDLGPYLAAFVEHGRGEVARLTGDLPRSRDLTRRAMERFRALGIETMAAGCYHHLASVELALGDAAGALHGLQESDAALARLGERSFRSTTQANLALVYAAIGDADAAHVAIALAEELGGPHDVVNNALTNAIRARLARTAGDGEQAERRARHGVEHAFAMDNPWIRGLALLELARALQLLGEPVQAATQARAALDVYEAKGDQPGIREATALLAELG